MGLRTASRIDARRPFALRGDVLAGAAGALTGVLLVLVTARTISDDSWITADYARTLVEHGQWGLVPGRWANTATSPLNVWLLAVGYAASGSMLVAFGTVLALSLGAIGWLVHDLAAIVRVSATGAVAATLALLVTSPLLVATVGLETYLGVAVLVALARVAAAGAVVPSGLVCGVAVLVRPDLTVPALVLALGLLGLPAARRVVGTALLVAVPWHLFAWVVLGGLIPDTIFFKSGGPPGALLGAVGTLWFVRMPMSTTITVVLVVAGVVCAIRARHRRDGAERVVFWSMAAGLAHLVGLSLIGTGPQLWYYGPVVGFSAFAVGLSVARRPTTWASAGVAAFATVSLAVSGYGGLPWWAATMNSNWAVSSDYARIGAEVAAIVGPASVHAPGEIGALAYSCRCDMVDQFADPNLADVVMRPKAESLGRVGRAVLAVNTVFRSPTPRPDVRYSLLSQFPPAADPPDTIASWTITAPQSGSPLRIVLVRLP